MLRILLSPVDSKTLKEEKREELFENLKADESIGWSVDVIDPRELSAKMLKKSVGEIITCFSFSLCVCMCSLAIFYVFDCQQE